MERAFLWRSAWLLDGVSESSCSLGSAPGLKLDRVRPSPRAGGGGGRKEGGGPESRRKSGDGGGGGAVWGGGGMKLSVREELRGKRLSWIREEMRSSSGVPARRHVSIWSVSGSDIVRANCPAPLRRNGEANWHHRPAMLMWLKRAALSSPTGLACHALSVDINRSFRPQSLLLDYDLDKNRMSK